MHRLSITLVALLSVALLLALAGTALAADSAAGHATYDRLCQSCHGPAGVGASGPPLNTASFASRYDTVAKLKTVTREGAPGMPAFGPQLLGDAELDNLLAYMVTLLPAGSTPPSAAPTAAAPAAAPAASPTPAAPARPALPLEQLYALAVLVLAAVNAVAMFIIWKLVNRTPAS